MKNHQLINQDSGKTEYYTPLKIIEAARRTMGSIDLDPASSEIANKRINAANFYTEYDNGLNFLWYGNIWMNHPFSRLNNKLFIEKLIYEYHKGRVKQACCITYAATSEIWFRPLLEYPQCFLYGRTNYALPDGSIKRGVTKGSVVTYLGPNIEVFKKYFRSLGAVKI